MTEINDEFSIEVGPKGGKLSLKGSSASRSSEQWADLFSPFSEIGGAIGDHIRIWRATSVACALEKAHAKAEKRGIDIRPASPKFLVHWAEKASLEDSEDLSDLWANLLLSAMGDFDSESLWCVNLLSEIGPTEARLLSDLHTKACRFGADATAWSEKRWMDNLEQMIEKDAEKIVLMFLKYRDTYNVWPENINELVEKLHMVVRSMHIDDFNYQKLDDGNMFEEKKYVFYEVSDSIVSYLESKNLILKILRGGGFERENRIISDLGKCRYTPWGLGEFRINMDRVGLTYLGGRFVGRILDDEKEVVAAG